MAYVVKVTVPGVARPMFSEPMRLADARLAEKTLKRRQGFGVTIKHVPPRVRSRRVEHDQDDTLEARLERVAAARRAS